MIKPKYVKRIEELPEIKIAAKALAMLEEKGLVEPYIAAGWIRSYLTGAKTTDIDIAYVGNVHCEDAQEHLSEILDKLNIPNKEDWDIEGIWNAQMAFPEIKSTKEYFQYFYVCSIDSVYLASDGKLHDLTGFGFDDAKAGVLRMHDFEDFSFKCDDKEIVYFCTEGCRRIAKYGWKPTERSVELIKNGRVIWDTLSSSDKEFFYKRIKTKFTADEMKAILPTYAELGWDILLSKV